MLDGAAAPRYEAPSRPVSEQIRANDLLTNVDDHADPYDDHGQRESLVSRPNDWWLIDLSTRIEDGPAGASESTTRGHAVSRAQNGG